MAAVLSYTRQDRQHLGQFPEVPSEGPLSSSKHSTATTGLLQPASKLSRCQMLHSGADGLQVSSLQCVYCMAHCKDPKHYTRTRLLVLAGAKRGPVLVVPQPGQILFGLPQARTLLRQALRSSSRVHMCWHATMTGTVAVQAGAGGALPSPQLWRGGAAGGRGTDRTA